MAEEVKKPGIIQGILVFLFISIIFYFLARTIFVLSAQYGRLEKTLAFLFLIAEIFVMFQAFGYFGAIYKLSKKKRIEPNIGALKDFPSIAILTPARHEPKDILENTIMSIYNLDYLNKTIYILDDSSDEKYKKEADELAKQYGVKCYRREPRHGAKAGIINDCVKGLTDKYVAIFDVDQCPIAGFLLSIIPILEADPKLAFVQTPQFYSNMESTKVSFASNMQQAVFYEYICEGKSTNDAMICCGTNVVLRREALLDVGGLDESTVTEDFATSIKLHRKGWRSLYYNHVGTFGMGPEDLGSYFKQQNRWAMGNVGVLRTVLLNFLKSPFSLKPIQWFEYMITGSYYLIGWAYLFLMVCPVMYLLFGIPSFFMNPVIYVLTFMPYLILSVAIFEVGMIGRHYSMKQMLKGQLLGFITLPVYMRAALFGAIGVKGTFQVTGKGGSKIIPYSNLWPQLALWGINLSAITWGLNRFLYEPTAAIAMNIMWVIYHFSLLSGIFYFNEEKSLENSCKNLRRRVRFGYKRIAGLDNIEKLERETWKICFNAILSEQFNKGIVLMCKITNRNKEVIIFDGNVLGSSKTIFGGKFRTTIGAVTISEKDKERLKGVMR